MSLLPLATFTSPGVALYGGGGGGGGGGSGSFSTVTASTISVSSITASGGISANGLATTNGLTMSNTGINFSIPGASGPSAYFNAGDSNLYISGLSTHTVNIGTASNQSLLQVGDTTVTITQNLNVSSINGSWPPKSFSVPVSTLAGTQTYIPANNVAWPLSGDIGVVAGRSYRISSACAVNSPGGSGYTTIAITGGGAGFPQFITTYLNANALPANNGLSGGISAVCTPASSGNLQIVGYNSDPAQSTLIDFYKTSWVVEDLGAGL